jgi:hypothetical protein
MIIKATLFVLIILLVVVIGTSYYANKEAFENMSSPTKRYIFFVNRYEEPTGTPVCLSTLAGGKVGISNKCDVNSPKQIWFFNQDGNLLTEDPDYKDKCLQLNKDGSLTLSTCTINSTQFTYNDTDKKLIVSGSNPSKCVNLVKGLYEEGSLVNAIQCTQARADTVTWFRKEVPTSVNTEKTVTAPTVGTGASGATTGAGVVTGTTTATGGAGAGAGAGTGAGTGAETGSVPQKHTIVPDTSISETGSSAKALQDQMSILKDIQKQLTSHVLSSRSTEVNVPGDAMPMDSALIQQGKEYHDNCYKDQNNTNAGCATTPDMAKYIKKDQIPCWGCNLDY